MNKKGQKVLKIALATFVAVGVLSTPVNVFAAEVSTSDFTIDNSEIIYGYDRIYRDVPGSQWIMVKPEKPESKKIGITLDNSTVGSTYTFTLMDYMMEKEIKKIAGVVEINKVDFILYENILDGEYKLVGQVGNNEPTIKDITINGNIALDATITSNLGGSVNNLKDLTIANYLIKDADKNKHEDVTYIPPIEMTFDLKNNSEISSLRVFSNNVGDH